MCLATALLVTLLGPPSACAQAAIPDRPEKLAYPPLTYEPPAPEKYRVTLKSGPVAYLAADRELPLINIVVYAHAGIVPRACGQRGSGGPYWLPAGARGH